MHIHILGICGTFMGGLAVLARQAGHTVTGCDENIYPPMSTQLQAAGIQLHVGFDAEQLKIFNAELYVIGNIMTRGMPVIEEILNRSLPYTSGPQWLGENVLQGKWVLAVAGTHGKTSTSAMLAWVLEHAGLAPGFLIGGIPTNFGISARPPRGDSPFFVIEADEYDTAFFDKRSKFVHYRARTVILNNLEYDHADIFPNVEAIQTQFHHLVRTVPANGLIVSNGRDEYLKRTLLMGCWSSLEEFGPGLLWDFKRAERDTQFNVIFKGIDKGMVDWDQMGIHNTMNALAAIAAARHAGVPTKMAIDALSDFAGVARRMENKGEIGGVTVFDDFAHHPTAFHATLAGLRKRVGDQRIIAVLEPRTNTMKQGTMREALPNSLANADAVFVYAKGLGWDVAKCLEPISARTGVFEDLDAMVNAIVVMSKPGDQILVMSNGGFGGVHGKILTMLGERAMLPASIPN